MKKQKTHFNKGRIPWNKGLVGVYKLSEETRRKIGEAIKGRPCWWKGKHLSEEHRMKISLGNMGRYQPPRDGKNNGMFGKTHSEETKRKMSEGMKLYYKNRKNKKP